MRRLAARQHGLLTIAQLWQLGLTRHQVAHACARRLLFRVHRGVYCLGRALETPIQAAAAAVLACGPDSALSDRWALWLWSFIPTVPKGPCHVTTAHDTRPPGVVVHRPRNRLARDDIRTQLGIRVTSPARTLLDCAPSLSARRLHRIAADARRSGHLHMDSLVQTLIRFPHHRGHKKLLSLADGLESPTRSELEDAFLEFCRHYGLPTPLVNTRIAGHEVDMVFPEARVIVELDGWDFHRDRVAFEVDRDRELDTAVAGFVTVHLTWARLMQAPEREARRLAQLVRDRERELAREPEPGATASGSARARPRSRT